MDSIIFDKCILRDMDYVRKTVSGTELKSFFNNIPISLRNRRVEVIILPLDNNEIFENPDYSCKLDFVKGAELPDSFFDPLPEEEVQAWGL